MCLTRFEHEKNNERMIVKRIRVERKRLNDRSKKKKIEVIRENENEYMISEREAKYTGTAKPYMHETESKV